MRLVRKPAMVSAQCLGEQTEAEESSQPHGAPTYEMELVMSDERVTVDGWEMWRIDDGETHHLLVNTKDGESWREAAIVDDSGMFADWQSDGIPEDVEAKPTTAKESRALIRWDGHAEPEEITLLRAGEITAQGLRGADRHGRGRLVSSTVW